MNISPHLAQLDIRLAEYWRQDTVEWLRHHAPKIVGVIIISVVLLAILRQLTAALTRYSRYQTLGVRAQQLRTLAGVINSFGTFIILFLAMVQVLPIFGLDIRPLLASAGIVGLAIGFGAQTLVRDVINGFFILVEDQYAVGDTIRAAGVTGTVEELTLRRTILRDADGAVHTVPNSEVKVVSNFTRDWHLLALTLTVDNSASSERVIATLTEEALAFRNDPRYSSKIVSEPEVPGITRVSGRQVDYGVRLKVRPGEQFGITRALRAQLESALAKNGMGSASSRAEMRDDSGANKVEIR
jgi:moderate conductance mechanosensitive channel